MSGGMKIIDHVLSDRGSKYAVSGGVAASRAEAQALVGALKRNKRFAKATHNSWAVLLSEGAEPIKADDGEAGAGAVILRMLEREGLYDHVIVVVGSVARIWGATAFAMCRPPSAPIWTTGAQKPRRADRSRPCAVPWCSVVGGRGDVGAVACCRRCVIAGREVRCNAPALEAWRCGGRQRRARCMALRMRQVRVDRTGCL